MSHGHKGHHSGSEWELLYRHEYHGKEFIIRIDNPEKFEQWKKDHSIALLEFISVPEVFISENNGHAGTLGRPSNELLVEAFKSSKFEDVFAFLAEHGHLQASGHHANLRGKETGSH